MSVIKYAETQQTSFPFFPCDGELNNMILVLSNLNVSITPELYGFYFTSLEYFYTLFLFTKSDFKTLLLPVVSGETHRTLTLTQRTPGMLLHCCITEYHNGWDRLVHLLDMASFTPIHYFESNSQY